MAEERDSDADAGRLAGSASTDIQKTGLRVRLRLGFGDDTAIGPGKAELLERIRQTGSIAAAGRAMGMSYKRAWLLVGTMNRCFAEPLVTVSRGGQDGGGADLTPTGAKVLSAYREMVEQVESGREFGMIEALIASGADGKIGAD